MQLLLSKEQHAKIRTIAKSQACSMGHIIRFLIDASEVSAIENKS
jgi:hypothetical protein